MIDWRAASAAGISRHGSKHDRYELSWKSTQRYYHCPVEEQLRTCDGDCKHQGSIRHEMNASKQLQGLQQYMVPLGCILGCTYAPMAMFKGYFQVSLWLRVCSLHAYQWILGIVIRPFA